MADNTDSITAQITGSIVGLKAAMVQGAAVVREGTESITGSFETMSAGIEAALAPLLAITILLEGGHLFKEIVEGAAETAEQLDVTAQKTGIAAEELSALQFAAELSDVSIDTLNNGLKFLAKNMEAGAAGFKAMGVETKNADGSLRPLRDVLLDTATKFAGYEDGAAKSALAMNIFGRAGADLIPLLNQGAGGIAALEARARELGITMGEDDVAAAKKYDDQMKEFHSVMTALGRDLAVLVIPVLTKLAEWAEKGAAAMIRLLEKIRILKPDLTSALDNDPNLIHALGLDKKTEAPGVTPDKGGASFLEKLREQWNKVKEGQLGSDNDLLVMEILFWKKKISQAEVGSKDYLEIHNHIVDLESQLAERSAREQEKAQKEIAKGWLETFKAIPSAWNDAVKNWKSGAQSMGDFWKDLMGNLVKDAASAELEMLENYASMWLARKGLSVQGFTEEVLASTWSTLKIVGNYAIQAAAAAWAALAGIPYIGPFLAPAVAAATLAGVLALASGGVSFGGGGSGRSSGSGSASTSAAPTSAAQAQPVHVTIQAMDARSFHDFAMGNAAAFARATAAGAAAGARLPNSVGRG